MTTMAPVTEQTRKQAITSAIARIQRLRWEPDTSRTNLHVPLLREYLRRAALWAEALECTDRWPFFDVAPHVAPSSARVDEAQWKALEKHLTGFDLFGPIKRSCLWYVEWAGVQDLPEAVRFDLPAPYDPLIAMYEQGGEFSMEHGYFDFTGGGFPVGKWSQYRTLEPHEISEHATQTL